uniref:Uncharacterized protein n=1 Tax=Panagrolaimus sp. JU765 TaxID=591449 RepID=A0AC34Q9V5_9BILA
QRYETQTIPSQHSSDFRNGSDSSLPHVVINDFADVETNYDVNNNSFGNNRIASDAGSFVIQDAGHTPVLMNRMQPFDRSNHSGVRLNFSDTSQNNYFGQREPEMQESVYADRNLNR